MALEDDDILVVVEPPADINVTVEQGIFFVPSGNSFVKKMADIALSGHRAVYIKENSKVNYADKDDLTSALMVLGITVAAASADTLVDVQYSGELVEPSWNWVVNSPVYLGSNGLLTQVVPTTGLIRQLGIPSAPTSLFIEIQSLIKLI